MECFRRLVHSNDGILIRRRWYASKQACAYLPEALQSLNRCGSHTHIRAILLVSIALMWANTQQRRGGRGEDKEIFETQGCSFLD